MQLKSHLPLILRELHISAQIQLQFIHIEHLQVGVGSDFSVVGIRFLITTPPEIKKLDGFLDDVYRIYADYVMKVELDV